MMPWHLHRLVMVATALAAACIIGAVNPASAGAATTSLAAAPGPEGTFGTNCTYTLTAQVDTASPVMVHFYDETSLIGSATARVLAATVEWTPTSTGEHQLRAYQEGSGHSEFLTVDVRQGLDLGSSCLVL
ncbi:hypothetical protein GIY30_11805 [Gordonia sp. HNM0687]|uniref:Ig-like domain-containing protein n=1 Tax=Gordonia mangrovi TaxID=2665643 RepID=A0A6L7GQ50_9ACTN|nr:hypothetical protein [Gordonia mangrovi]MXP22030.1 hypothetical protein [Gordonia mangrovi]UVF78040.1 hypothetical protein NWF22_22930 [Gordonia mangrovi]